MYACIQIKNNMSISEIEKNAVWCDKYYVNLHDVGAKNNNLYCIILLK